MTICPICYRELKHRMFSPYDYVWSKKLSDFISSCCNAKVRRIDGRQYHKIVKQLEEEKKLKEWHKLVKPNDGEMIR